MEIMNFEASSFKINNFLMACFGLMVFLGSAQNARDSGDILVLQSRMLESLKGGGPIDFLYDNASGLYLKESLQIGPAAISEALKNLNKEDRLVKYDTVVSFQLYKGQKLILGAYTTEKGTKIPSVTGWRSGNKWTKAFEVMAQQSQVKESGKRDIDLLRSSWELFSNQHRPDLIVKNVFASSGRYFYQGTEFKGTDIAEAYGYMKEVTYAIDLTPLKVVQVNDQLIYEIGVYETNGKGLYFLLWTKEKLEWKLMLDFNF